MEVLKDEICFDCGNMVKALEAYRESNYNSKTDRFSYKFFHKECAEAYCKRQKLGNRK